MKKEKLIENFFLQEENIVSVETIDNLIKEQFQKLQEALVVPKKTEFKLDSVPDVQVDQVYWGKIGNISGQVDVSRLDPDRGMLYLFLKNIPGNTLDTKLQSINNFYNIESIEQFSKRIDTGALKDKYDTIGKKISLLISFLVFIKTLTKILSQINASSAGFTFESFLAVLLKGRQVAQTGTLIDVEAPGNKGENLYISCKLTKKGARVVGSMNNLVNDLKNNKTIFYLVGDKELSGGNSQKGTIVFRKFPLNLDNLYEIADVAGSPSTRDALRVFNPKQQTKKQKEPTIQKEPEQLPLPFKADKLNEAEDAEKADASDDVEDATSKDIPGIDINSFYSFEESRDMFLSLKTIEEKIGFLKNSYGVIGKLQFSIKKENLSGLLQDVATIDVGEEKIIKLINNFKNEIYQLTLSAISNLYNANNLFNQYVAGGLEDDKKADICIDKLKSAETEVSSIKSRNTK